MLYNYDLEPMDADFQGVALRVTDEIVTGTTYELEYLYDYVKDEIEEIIAHGVEEEHPELDDDELEDLIGEAIEEDFEDVGYILTKDIRERIIEYLDSAEETINDSRNILD